MPSHTYKILQHFQQDYYSASDYTGKLNFDFSYLKIMKVPEVS